MEQTQVSFADRLINTAWELGPEIIRELSNKNYKRVGGIILKTTSNEVVAFIRQNNQSLGEIVKNSTDDPTLKVLDLPQVNPAIDLSVSTMGPATIMLKLNSIEQKLTSEMVKLNRKFDLGIYAKFQAGLTLADNAFRMSKQSSRQTAANNAIALFLEAENFFLKLFDEEMEQQSLAAYPYLATLFLAYVSEARCYLELEEIDTTQRRLAETGKILKPRVQKFHQTFLTEDPAMLLHPALQDQIDLERVTRLMRFGQPDLTENEVFEKLRGSLWQLAVNPDGWLAGLPPDLLPLVPEKSKSKLTIPWSNKGSGKLETVLEKLPGMVETIEEAITTMQNVQGFEIEVEYLKKSGGTFAEWQELVPPDALVDHALLFLTPVEMAAA